MVPENIQVFLSRDPLFPFDMVEVDPVGLDWKAPFPLPSSFPRTGDFDLREFIREALRHELYGNFYVYDRGFNIQSPFRFEE